jgi:hypothetical protein
MGENSPNLVTLDVGKHVSRKKVLFSKVSNKSFYNVRELGAITSPPGAIGAAVKIVEQKCRNDFFPPKVHFN